MPSMIDSGKKLLESWKLRLLAPKHFREFGSQAWREYVESLHQAPQKAKAWSFRRNNRGTPIITIRERKPKYLDAAEFAELLDESKMLKDELIALCKEKDIVIKF